MKRNYQKVLSLLIFFFTSLLGYATDTVEIDGITYNLHNNNGKLSADVSSPEKGSYSGDIVIPKQIIYNGNIYPVTQIAGYAFSYDPITSIKIPNSIKEIRINAFLSCQQLKEIKIPNSVTKIGVAVFKGCSSLKNVIFEDGSNTLTFGTQSNCVSGESFESTNVDSLYLGRPIESDGSSPFRGMSKSLRALDMRPNWGKRTGTWFQGFSSLKNVYLSNNLTAIDNEAFSGCSSLSSILISNGISSIGIRAFYECSSLQDVRIPTSVTSIADNAFSWCKSMKSLIVLGEKCGLGRYVGSGGMLFAYKEILDRYDKYLSDCKTVEITNPYYAIVYNEQKLSSITFTIKDISHPQSRCPLKKVEFNDNEITPNEDGVYSLTNLKPAQEYKITLVLNDKGTEKRIDCPIKTVSPQFIIYTYAYITDAKITIETPKK